MSELPEWIREALGNPISTQDAWAQVSGYVAGMVGEGSEDAAQILALMHELKPATRIFTGTVEELRSNEDGAA